MIEFFVIMAVLGAIFAGSATKGIQTGCLILILLFGLGLLAAI